MVDKLIVGKWYRRINSLDNIGKLTETPTKDMFPSKEYIYNGKYTNQGSHYTTWNKDNVIEVPIEEIAKYLPEGHEDLKLLNSLKSFTIW